MTTETTDNTSPRPWHREPGDNPRDFSRTEDADGCFIFGDNSGPRAADADLIVRAVNNHDGLVRANEILRAECRALAVESDRLTDIVRRMLPCVLTAFDYAVERGNAVKGLCALKGIDSSKVDEIQAEWRTLIDDARAAIGEEAAND